MGHLVVLVVVRVVGELPPGILQQYLEFAVVVAAGGLVILDLALYQLAAVVVDRVKLV